MLKKIHKYCINFYLKITQSLNLLGFLYASLLKNIFFIKVNFIFLKGQKIVSNFYIYIFNFLKFYLKKNFIPLFRAKIALFSLVILNIICVQERSFASMEEYEVKIKDHKFDPEILQIPANKKFKLIVKNLDKSAEEFESTDLNKEKIILGESKAIIIIDPLKSGEYSFFGEFHQKTAKGKIIAK